MNATIRAVVLAAALAAVLSLVACGSQGDGETPTGLPSATGAPSATPPVTTTSPAPAPAPSDPSSLSVVSVYFMRGQHIGAAHRAVPATNAPARAAIEQLLDGPSPDELAAGLHTQIPPQTELLGITIRSGVATVDLSGGFAAGGDPLADRGRLAQIVYTLTQFPTVGGVRLRLDGKPLVISSGEGTVEAAPQTRASFEDVAPAIFVELPAPGDAVGSPLIVTGTANTFEAQFFVRVEDTTGKTLVNVSVMATSGSGTRGTFNEAVSFSTTSPRVTLEVYESSAADGRAINVVRIPLLIEAGGAE